MEKDFFAAAFMSENSNSEAENSEKTEMNSEEAQETVQEPETVVTCEEERKKELAEQEVTQEIVDEVYDQCMECDKDYVQTEQPEAFEENTPKSDIESKIDVLNESVLALTSAIKCDNISRDRKDNLLSSMSAELQKYKDGMYARVFKPILMDIIYLREDLRKMYRAYEKKETETFPKEKILDILDSYVLDITDLLEKYDVTVFESEIGTAYIPIKQKIIKTIETTEEKNGTIAEATSNGYMLDGAVISPEKVNVYKNSNNKKETENGGN